MKRLNTRNRASGALATGVAAALMLLAAGNAGAQADIDGISLTTMDFTAKAGEVSTPDGGAIHFWGYQEDSNAGGLPAGALPQYPGPTLIVNQNDLVTINFKSDLPFAKCSSMIFPGQKVSASGGVVGVITNESCGAARSAKIIAASVLSRCGSLSSILPDESRTTWTWIGGRPSSADVGAAKRVARQRAVIAAARRMLAMVARRARGASYRGVR